MVRAPSPALWGRPELVRSVGVLERGAAASEAQGGGTGRSPLVDNGHGWPGSVGVDCPPARRVHRQCIAGTWCATHPQYSVLRMATTEPTSPRGRLGQPGSRGRDCHGYGTIAADAGDAAMMVISSRTAATIETLIYRQRPRGHCCTWSARRSSGPQLDRRRVLHERSAARPGPPGVPGPSGRRRSRGSHRRSRRAHVRSLRACVH